MHHLDLIVTLAFGLIAALALGYLAHRLGWSPIVGYLVAGIVAGPYTPGFIANKQLSDQMAEIGVILLMFGVGLHFHLADLLAVKRIAIFGALGQSIIATLTGMWVSHWFGWNWHAGIVFGMALSVASTVVLTRVLSDTGQLQSPTGRVAIGWLVTEDILTVFVLVLLPVLFAGPGERTSTNIPVAIGMAVLKLALFIGFTLFAGGRLIPRLLQAIARTRSRELFTLAVLAIALGIAVGAAYLFGASMALGAFLAGLVVRGSDFSARAAAEALPMRDAFAVMFFVSVGMLFDPLEAFRSPLPLLATLAVVLIAKPVAAVLMAALLGYSSRIGLGVAMSLAQIGEFSFVLVAVGRTVGALPEGATSPVVGAAMISIVLNPLLCRSSGSMEAFLERRPRLWKLLNRNGVRALREEPPESDHTPSHRAVLVGYGPIGKAVERLLQERGIETTIIEMNIATHGRLRSEGRRAVYGDANQREVLEQAGVAHARSLILSASGAIDATEAIRTARELNPRIHVVARAGYLSEAEPLRQAGADQVFSGEAEVALAMTDSILRQLGATPEQLDEEHERIRTELFDQGQHHTRMTMR